MRMESPLFYSSQLIELHYVHKTDVIISNKIFSYPILLSLMTLC